MPVISTARYTALHARLDPCPPFVRRTRHRLFRFIAVCFNLTWKKSGGARSREKCKSDLCTFQSLQACQNPGFLWRIENGGWDDDGCYNFPKLFILIPRWDLVFNPQTFISTTATTAPIAAASKANLESRISFYWMHKLISCFFSSSLSESSLNSPNIDPSLIFKCLQN